MITMEMLGKVRRLHLRDKLSLHEIAKRTGLSRNTVRKWLRTAEEVAEPVYQRKAKPGKLTPFHAVLELALKADAHRIKQNRRTAKALFAEIKAAGYAGAYCQVTAFIRAWREAEGKTPRAFVPLIFEQGEAFQFDWSEEGLVIGGIYRRLQVSHMKLCASRAFWLVAYPGSVALAVNCRNFPGMACPSSNGTDLSCQRIKSVCERHRIDAIDRKLVLANHVHELNSGENRSGSMERLEVQHRLGYTLDSTVVLLDDIVEVLDLANDDRLVATGVDRIDGCLVGAALVHCDLVRDTVGSHGPVEEALSCHHVALGRQQEVNCLAQLVDSTVEVFPDAFDLDVRFSIRQLPPTGCLCLRAIFSMSGTKRIAHRLMDEWSTDTPRSSIISSRCR